MSITDELQLLINTKEQIRLAVGASKTVPFSAYVDLIGGNPAPQLTVDPALIGIERQTAILANTKESLRVVIGLSKDVPFSQYASHIPPYEKSDTVFDFVDNQYTQDQMPVNLSDISEFIRLSSATMWQEDGNVIEVDVNVPRISSEGLLIEPQRTNTSVGTVKNYFSRTDSGSAIWGQADGALSAEEDFYRFEKTNKAVTDRFYRYNNGVDYPDGIVTGSIFVKKGDATARYLKLFSAASGGANSSFDLDTYTVNASSLPDRTLDARADTKASIARVSHSALNEDLNTFFPITLSDSPLPNNTNDASSEDGHYHLFSGIQVEDGLYPTSYIHALSAPATRASDVLNIPLLPSQTITGDWDAGVTYEVADNIATFTGHGYIRNITVEAL